MQVVLRDKWHFFIRGVLFDLASKLDILSELSDEEKGEYLEVYRQTLEHYLQKAFRKVTEYLMSVAKAYELEFKPEYESLTALFNPEKMFTSQKKKLQV